MKFSSTPAQVSIGPLGSEPLAVSTEGLVVGSPEGVGPAIDLTRYVKSIEFTPPRIRHPELKKGDRIRVQYRDGSPDEFLRVVEVDDDGNGTLERIDPCA